MTDVAAVAEMVEFDHVMFATQDPERVRMELADEWGLHVHPDAVDFADGISNLIVPLQPPQYLEILYVRNENVFQGAEDAAIVGVLRDGGGLLGVVLRTSNLAAVSEALRQPSTSGAGVAAEPASAPPWRLRRHRLGRGVRRGGRPEGVAGTGQTPRDQSAGRAAEGRRGDPSRRPTDGAQ